MTIVGLAEDARELSRRTVDRLAGALPAEVGPRLRGEYYRVAYPELDAVAPVFPLGLFFGRLGCFSRSCCWGQEAGPGALIPVQ